MILLEATGFTLLLGDRSTHGVIKSDRGWISAFTQVHK